MIFNESTTISDWHYLQLSEAEFHAMIAEDGVRYHVFEERAYRDARVGGYGYRGDIILSEEIDSWLREHCGFARLEYWGFPRVIYDLALKEDLEGRLRTDWETSFTPAPYNRRNWYFDGSRSRIYFRLKEYAMAFKLAFHAVEDGYVG